VDQELVAMIAGNGFARVLQYPIGSGMRRQVVVENSAATDLHHNQDEQHPGIGQSRPPGNRRLGFLGHGS
jgi:hypothetical protein